MENKTGRYFKYAIGEIVLVVIGILIALQINNWNENQKLDKIRQNYYHQLAEDLDSEIQNLDKRIIRLDKSIDSYEAYKEIETSDLKPIEIIQALGKVEFTWAYLSFYSKTIETLESTGDIKLIPPLLRIKLIELKRAQESIITVATGNDNVYLINLQKAGNLGFYSLIKYSSNEDINQKIKLNYSDIILTLEASLVLKNYSEIERSISLKSMLEKVNELNALIRQELNK